MSYDPDPRRRAKRRKGGRRGRVPPQLRAWVFGRRRRRTHDPAYLGRYKSYRTGPRGGRYWQGPKKRRYDPARKPRFARVRRYGRRIGGKLENAINKFGTPLGAGLAALAGIWTGINNQAGTKKAEDYFARIYGGKLSDGTQASAEVMHLTNFNMGDPWNVANYLKYKFLGIDPSGQASGSAWVLPFWASLIGWITSKIPIPVSGWARVRKPLGKIAGGALVVSTIGALALPGCSPTNPTSNPSSSPTVAYTYVGR